VKRERALHDIPPDIPVRSVDLLLDDRGSPMLNYLRLYYYPLICTAFSTPLSLRRKGKAFACVGGKRIAIGPYNVLQQAKRYARGFPPGDSSLGSFGEYRIPFVYSTNGINIWFQDLRHPLNLSPQVSAFHRPQALRELLEKDNSAARQWLQKNKVDNSTLWPLQVEAIQAIEKALLDGHRHIFIRARKIFSHGAVSVIELRKGEDR